MPDEDFVRGYDPQGQKVRIPRASLPKALSMGFKTAEGGLMDMGGPKTQASQGGLNLKGLPGRIPMNVAKMVMDAMSNQQYYRYLSGRQQESEAFKDKQLQEKLKLQEDMNNLKKQVQEAGMVEVTPDVNKYWKERGLPERPLGSRAKSSDIYGGRGGAGGTQFKQSDIEAHVKNAIAGKENPYTLPGGMSANALKPQVLNRLALEKPELMNKLYDDFINRSARDRKIGSIQIVVGAAKNTVSNNLDKMEELINNLSPTSIEAINSAYRKGLKSIAGDKEASELLTYVYTTQTLEAQVLKGSSASPTDAFLKEAQKFISPGLTPQGFRGMREALENENQSRFDNIGADLETFKRKSSQVPNHNQKQVDDIMNKMFGEK